MVFHSRTPILKCFNYLLWFYFLTDSEFSCLAMLAKLYPLSGPTYLPLIPNQLHCMSNCAHEVPGTMCGARLMAVLTIFMRNIFAVEHRGSLQLYLQRERVGRSNFLEPSLERALAITFAIDPKCPPGKTTCSSAIRGHN